MAIGLLFFVELSLPVPYIYKIALKLCLFLLPLIWVSNTFFAKPDVRKTKFALWLGIGSVLLIFTAYWFLQGYIDLANIRQLLEQRQRITKEVYVFVFIYSCLGNSLIEEIFFRGIVVQNLRYRPWVISSALFSFYHLTIFVGWFSPWILLLAMVSLFIGGLMFCWLNASRNSIWNSWLMHIFADIAIFGIGFSLFL